MMPRRTVWSLVLGPILLSACATDALRMAPARSDIPWTPRVSSSGEVLPGSGSEATRHGGLRLPAGYRLPSDSRIHTRLADPGMQAGRSYSLAELIDVAQSSNPTTRRAWDTARDAALAVGIARSTYLPQLTATVVGGYSHTQGRTTDASVSNGGTAGQIVNSALDAAQNQFGDAQNRRSGSGEVQTLGLQWLLFDFGKREAVIEAARQGQLATNILFTAAHQKVIYSVALGFYNHAAANARVALVKQARDNALKVQTAAEARLRQGQGTIVDVTQARQMTAQAELHLVQAEGTAQNAYLDLMTAMGISPQTRVSTQDVSGRPLSMEDARLTEDMVRQAVARRPDVQAAYAMAKAANSRVRAARSEFLPKVFVSGNVAYTTGRLALSSVPGVGSDSSPTLNLSSNAFSSLILGGITVPIFDGGLRAALLKQAQDQSDSAETTLRQTLDESVTQIVAAQNGLRTGLAAYQASGKLMTASQTSFDAAFAAYRNGVGSVTQATMAQTALFDATLARSDAYYAALIAAASLAFATGSLDGATSL